MHKQTQACESELQSLKMAALDEVKYLQLAENLAGFRSKLRLRAETLDIAVRQQILRLLVKEVLVGNDTVTLRHSIPITRSEPGPSGSPALPAADTGSTSTAGYLLRSGSRDTTLRGALQEKIAYVADFVYTQSRMGRKVTIDVTESGRKGGKARAANLSPKELKAASRVAINARWEQYYKDHPEKLKARQEREARKTGKPGRPPKQAAAKPSASQRSTKRKRGNDGQKN